MLDGAVSPRGGLLDRSTAVNPRGGLWDRGMDARAIGAPGDPGDPGGEYVTYVPGYHTSCVPGDPRDQTLVE